MFGTIVSGTVSFAPRSEGVYQDVTKSFSDPSNQVRMRPSKSISKTGLLTCGIIRILEKDETLPSGAKKRHQALIQITITTPSGSLFTTTELDSAANDITAICTPEVVSRLLQGEA